MSIFDFFRHYSTRKQRKAEIAFNCSMAELTRKASSIKRQADRLKMEAIQLEKNGDHQRAVSAAVASSQQAKSYMSALHTIQTCKNMHMQVKSQKSMKELLASCTDMARSVCIDADAAKYMETQSDFVQTMEELEQSSEALSAVQEGFSADTDVQTRNEAGEQILAQFMEELLPKAPSVQAEPPAALPVSEQDPKDDQHRAWADDRRRLLAEMM